nr:T6SS immunity protein Tli4 family protein [uncultured Massilia sp.]
MQRRLWLYLSLILLLVACKPEKNKLEKANMTLSTPRLQAAFEKTKTICFGRFMIDVPATAEVVWGKSLVPLGVDIYVNGVDEVKKIESQFIDELKGEKAINHDDAPLLLSIEDTDQPPGRLVTGYEDFEAINGLKINGYFQLNNDGVIITSRPLRADREGTVTLINSMAKRLRHRAEDEIPTEPGNCIEHAFLPDLVDPSAEDLMEHIRVGFRLKEFPDAHFSIYVAPANPHDQESDSLEKQFKRFKGGATTPEELKVLASIKYFRESPRRIREWLTGYEVLMRTPDEEGSLSHHDFLMKFTGVPYDPYKPYADIQFQTGVVDDAAGAGRASLTDEEAVALWDKITSTIRVRPTEAAAKNTAAEIPPLQLGALAATGRVCPQTGWWQSAEANVARANGRRHFDAGERMPHIDVAVRPTFWQRLKGEDAVYRVATMWKLVEYSDGSAPIASDGQARSPTHDSGETAYVADGADGTTPPAQDG